METKRLAVVSWTVRKIALPFLKVWLFFLGIIVLAFIFSGRPQPVEVYIFGVSLIVVPLAVAFSPLGVAAFYFWQMRLVYPHLEWYTTGQGYCDICRKKVERERFTRNLLLLPYTFKTLRHYEKAHPELAGIARNARLCVTASVHSYVFMFAFFIGLRSLLDLQVSLGEAMLRFLVAFLTATLIFYVLLAYFLVRKKGVGV